VDAYEDGTIEWGVDGVRDDVGGNGKRPCAVAPTLLRVKCERPGVTMCGGPTKDSHGDLVRIAAELSDVSFGPSQEKLFW